MEKSVLISIKPEWCEKIASGKKTIEVRKTRPKIETSFKCYIYETKDKKYDGTGNFCDTKKHIGWFDHSIGKVIGEFVCDRVDNIEIRHFTVFGHENLYCAIGENSDKQWLKHSCLNYNEVFEYGKGATLYGWHISELVIYDKPKELSEFQKACNRKEDCKNCKRSIIAKQECIAGLTRPPQSWCYVEGVE